MSQPVLEGDTHRGQSEPVAGGDSLEQDFLRESRAFKTLLPGLLETRPGRFVAVYKGEVIDEDEDEFELARRIEVSHRSEFVLVRRVCEDEPEDCMQTPEADAQ